MDNTLIKPEGFHKRERPFTMVNPRYTIISFNKEYEGQESHTFWSSYWEEHGDQIDFFLETLEKGMKCFRRKISSYNKAIIKEIIQS